MNGLDTMIFGMRFEGHFGLVPSLHPISVHCYNSIQQVQSISTYFVSMPKLSRDDFILSREESYRLAEMLGATRIGIDFCNVLVEECAGIIIDLISLSMAFLRIDFRFAYSMSCSMFFFRCDQTKSVDFISQGVECNVCVCHHKEDED